MATLPTLFPATPDGTVVTMAAPVGAATYAAAIQVNDGDTSYITSGLDTSGSVFVNLDNMPADFNSMDTLTVSCVVRLNGTRTDDTTQLFAQIYAADESTPLTDELLVTDHTTGPTYTVDSTPLVNVLASNKTTWDGAKLRLRWVFTKNMQSDGIALRVTQAFLDGTYTATVASPQTIVVGLTTELESAVAVPPVEGAVVVGVAGFSETETVNAVGFIQGAAPQSVLVVGAAEFDSAGLVAPVFAGSFPSAPENFVATANGQNQVDLSWDSVAGAAYYDIERDGVIIEKDFVGTSYSDTPLNPSTLYTYRVRAVKDGA